MFQDETEIVQFMSDSNIANYTIGFEGNQGSIDRVALENISVNGDFSFPKDIDELKEVFEQFSNNVAAVYDLEYNTNNAILEEDINLRFLFETTKIN